MTRWIALLRGVNVGGGNKLPMAGLRSTVEDLGLENVATYIQSGNVVFDVPGTAGDAEPELTARLATAIKSEHGLEVPVVLRSAAEMTRIAGAHPDRAGGLEPKFLHIQFLDRAPGAAAIAAIDPSAYDPDRWTVDGREIYVRYPGGSARSRLTIDVFERAFGVTATARNLNTVRRLVELADLSHDQA